MEPLHVIVDSPEYCLIPTYKVWWVCLDKGEWASWVQAVGALIAILFTIYQVWSGNRRIKREKKDKVAVVSAAISSLETRCGIEIFNLVWSTYDLRQASETLARDRELRRVVEVQELTRTIQLQDLPDPGSVFRVLEILRLCNETRAVYTRYSAMLNDENHHHFSLHSHAELKRELLPHIGAAKKYPGVDNS